MTTPEQATTVLQNIVLEAENIIGPPGSPAALTDAQIAAVQGVIAAASTAVTALTPTPPPAVGPVFDAVASGSAGAMGGFSVTDTHTATAGAAVLAFIEVSGGKTVSSITFGGAAMRSLGGVAFQIEPSGLDANVFVFELADVPAGPQLVDVTLSGFCQAVLATVSYTGVTTVGTPSTATGVGTSASQALTCAANQVIVEAIGCEGGKLSAPTGGTNRALVVVGQSASAALLAVSDSTTSPTTFGATLTSTSNSPTAPWGAIGVVLS